MRSISYPRGRKRNIHNRSQHRSFYLWQTVPKSVRPLLIAIVSLCAFAGFLQGRANHLDQIKKTRPTDFSRLHDLSVPLRSPTHPVRYGNGTHIDGYYAFVDRLGNGQEGTVSLYRNGEGILIAVKTFSLAARNDIPLELVGDFIDITTTWPSEIEAGLLLSTLSNTSYVPVLDYFILQEPAGWSWALVTPHIAGGTLLSLAAREKTAYSPSSLETLDGTYRQSLENLLLALENLHATGLCHDDIKPDNIFIGNIDSHWMLGDLGNVRDIKHPWHKTASWIRQNQLANCKINDVKRALKTYLSFLRSASTDSDAFDQQFWMGRSAWSRMYWDFTLDPVGAGRLVGLSEELYAQDQDNMLGISNDVESEGSLREATERELTCTSLPRRLWFL